MFSTFYKGLITEIIRFKSWFVNLSTCCFMSRCDVGSDLKSDSFISKRHDKLLLTHQC